MTASLLPSPAPARRAIGLVVAALSALTLVACGGGQKASGGATQVAAKVNDGEVSVHQVELAAQRELAVLPPAAASAALMQSAEKLVEQELAAQAARKESLDQDPRVLQMLELAKREVLARAWQDRVGSGAREPSSDEIDAYFNSHPALFAERRLYSMQETLVKVPPEQLAALRARLEAADSVSAVNAQLATAAVPHSARTVNLSAEDVPLSLLDKLSGLPEGRTLVLPGPDGLRLLTLLAKSPAPQDRNTATRAIRVFLLNERRATLVREAAKDLRAKASISWRGSFAELAQAASAPAPAASR